MDGAPRRVTQGNTPFFLRQEIKERAEIPRHRTSWSGQTARAAAQPVGSFRYAGFDETFHRLASFSQKPGDGDKPIAFNRGKIKPFGTETCPFCERFPASVFP